MFKYIKFSKVKDEFTTHEFRGGDDTVEVYNFDGVVSLRGLKADIDALIASQETVINCTEITQADFKALVRDSSQLNRIRQRVANKIAEKYTISEELAVRSRAADDAKRVAYESYVSDCVKFGQSLKADIGY